MAGVSEEPADVAAASGLNAGRTAGISSSSISTRGGWPTLSARRPTGPIAPRGNPQTDTSSDAGIRLNDERGQPSADAQRPSCNRRSCPSTQATTDGARARTAGPTGAGVSIKRIVFTWRAEAPEEGEPAASGLKSWSAAGLSPSRQPIWSSSRATSSGPNMTDPAASLSSPAWSHGSAPASPISSPLSSIPPQSDSSDADPSDPESSGV